MTCRLRRGLVAALSVLLTASCTTSSPDPSPSPTGTPSGGADTATPSAGESQADGGTLRFALGTDPAAIDPRFVRDEAGALVVDALFDSLVAVSDDLTEIEPAAATSWEVSDDGLLYTFRLREGATFHDGTPVTAGDFVRSFRRIVDGAATPPSFVYYKLAPVVGFEDARTNGTPLTGVRAEDDLTLEIELRYRFEDFLFVLADPSLAPVPASASEDSDGYGEEPVGNGPFAMAAPWQHNQFIRVVRNDDHHDEPLLNEIVFQVYADDASREAQYDDFRQGLVDVAEVPASQLNTARSTYGRSPDGYRGPGVIDGITGTVYYYGFNTSRPPFDDPAVRRALSSLIDRQAIVNEITLSTREPADGIVPPPVPGSAAVECGHCTYDPDGAVAALTTEEGTVFDALEGPLRILHNTGATNSRIAGRIAAGIENAVGIDVEVTSAELEPFVQQLREGDVHLFRLGWQAEYASAGSVLLPLFRTATIGQDNLTRYSNPAVDELLAQARQEPNRAARLDLFAQAEALILEDAPVAPIFFYRHGRVVADAASGFRIGPLGDVDWTRIEVTR